MPPQGERLSSAEQARLREWIAAGAPWPGHWAYRALEAPPVPDLADAKFPGTASFDARSWALAPIDRFVARELVERGLSPSPEADRRTLLRRVSLDLTGLPPTYEQTQAFLADTAPDAYERVVDRLLASPAHGERRARHWMDLVHFAESHGQDQDRPREHAWPYRDYLIRALNEDKPYSRFVEEQVAGDVLFPDDAWATVATGFLAAGPWDESSLRDIREDSADREIGRYLDRDDIVTTVMQTFASATVQCARCHDHKFDPISQQDYYSLQAVFAGTDKANRPYDTDPGVASARRERLELKASLPRMLSEHDSALIDAELQSRVAEWEASLAPKQLNWQVTGIASAHSADGVPLTLLDDGSLLAGGAAPLVDTYTIVLRAPQSIVRALKIEVLPDERLPHGGPGRAENGNFHLSEVRVEAIESPGLGDLADLARAATPGRRLKLEHPVADFDQADWNFSKAIDDKPETAWGIHPEEGKPHHAVIAFDAPVSSRAANDSRPGSETGSPPGVALRVVLEQLHGRNHVIGRLRLWSSDVAPAGGAAKPAKPEIAAILATPAGERGDDQRRRLAAAYLEEKADRELAALPAPSLVYCGTSRFAAEGSFRPTPAPRKVCVLHRGQLNDPRGEALPGALSCVEGLGRELAISELANEGERRAALAHWLSDRRNGLTWRSIVNRLWQHHLGQGLVETQSDFGRMGAAPSHPELLDYLAAELRDHGGSLKHLHRLIVTSAVYRQSSDEQPRDGLAGDALASQREQDPSDRWLWRMRRRRLDAESLRDSLLFLSGKLDSSMGGPSVKQFVQTPGVHVTPNVDYFAFPLDDPANRRRSVYRFLFRTLPDPFMESLDCPDASQLTPRRTESVTALQALATLHDRLVVRQCEFMAERIENESPGEPARQLFHTLLRREPRPEEARALGDYIARHGLANACRFVINTNEFMFVD